jgi:hypothetical protein
MGKISSRQILASVVFFTSVCVFAQTRTARNNTDDEENSRVGFPHSIPLGLAIADFNRRAHADRVGAGEPALTENEIVAAVRAWIGGAAEPTRLPAQVAQELRMIAAQRTMPKGSYLRFIPGLVAEDGYDVDVWWIDLQLDLDRYPTDLKDVPQRYYRIRTVYVDSRPHS